METLDVFHISLVLDNPLATQIMEPDYLSMFPIFVCLPKSLEDSSSPLVEYG